jgi:hypothetical protein
LVENVCIPFDEFLLDIEARCRLHSFGGGFMLKKNDYIYYINIFIPNTIRAKACATKNYLKKRKSPRIVCEFRDSIKYFSLSRPMDGFFKQMAKLFNFKMVFQIISVYNQKIYLLPQINGLAIVENGLLI